MSMDALIPFCYYRIMKTIQDILKILPTLTKKDSEFITRAYDFAQNAHVGQFRKSGEPYFLHVAQTGYYLAELGMPPAVVSAGLLHDTIEDTDVTAKDIENEFGKEVLELVKGVTKLGTVKYTGLERNVENLRKFFVSMAQDPRVLIIKLCDRLHNVETLQHVREDKQKRIALETLEIYAPLADRLSMGRLKGRLQDAAFPFAYKDAYEKTKQLLSQRKDTDERYVIELKKDLTEKLKKSGVKITTIDYRIKHLYSLWEKLEKYDGDISKVYDIIALRIIVPTIEDCYQTFGIIHGSYTPLPGKIKDYIALPKTNGYQSLHTTVFTGTGGIVEIQIRTEQMHLEAEYGLAAHFAYKEKIKLNNADIKKQYEWIERLRDTQKKITNTEAFFDSLKMDFFNDRVFVFTPKGDVIDLPVDASVVDFAYSVHSQIGNQAQGAKLNGKFVSLETKVKSGDICEIIRAKNAKPNPKWLEFVKTSIARNKIHKYIKENSLSDKYSKYIQ